jgi:tetratricopeptide (TPR) repeat protein
MKKNAIAIAKGRIGKTTILILSVLMNLYSQQRSSILLNNDILVIRVEGVAFLDSGITEADAKTFAINDAKRNALDQAGTYLESHTTVLNHQLVKDEIITFSAGLLKSKVLKEERTLINNMFAFKVNILAVIDTKLLNQRIEEIRKDEKLRRQLEAERERNKQLEAQILELQTSGKMATKQNAKILTDKLTASEWYEKSVMNWSDYNSAVQNFNKAIELNPRNNDNYNDRGTIFNDLGDYDSAIRDFNKAIELNPRNASGYYNRIPSVNPIFRLTREMSKLYLRNTNTEGYTHAGHFPEGQKDQNVQAGRDLSYQRQDPKKILPAT